MTEREKILRDTIQKAIAHADYTNPEGIIHKLREILEEADAIKDGPSEEDRKELIRVCEWVNMHPNLKHDRILWALRKLQQAWG